MGVSADIRWLLTTVLVALRFGVALALTPILAFGALPAAFRVLFVFALAALLGAGMGVSAAGDVQDIAGLAGMAAGEALLGALRAFGILAALRALQSVRVQ